VQNAKLFLEKYKDSVNWVLFNLVWSSIAMLHRLQRRAFPVMITLRSTDFIQHFQSHGALPTIALNSS
jgi:hypothetical protein